MRFENGYTGDGFTHQADEDFAEEQDAIRAKEALVGDCTCYHTCDSDSHSGHWHQHEGEPCPIHPDAPMVG
jgi:hypothetical protein